MRNGGKVLLAVLKLCVGIKIRGGTFDTNHSVTENSHSIKQSIAASVQKLHDSTVRSVCRVNRRVDMSGETISLSIGLGLAVDFLHVMYINWLLTTGFMVRDLIQVGTRFSARPDRPWGPTQPLVK